MKIKVKNPAKLPLIDYRELVPLQGDLKEFGHHEYEKLKSSINRFGFVFPVFVWHDKDTGEAKLIDGHGRRKLLTQEKAQPYEIPYWEIEAASEEEAKEMLLVATSQYQEITQEGLYEFTAGMDPEFLSGFTHFDGVFNFEPTEEIYEPHVNDEDIEEVERIYRENNIRAAIIILESDDFETATTHLEKFIEDNEGIDDYTEAIINILGMD